MTSLLEADAALRLGTAIAQATLNRGQGFCLSMVAVSSLCCPHGNAPTMKLRTLYSGWTANTYDLPAAFFEEKLPYVQHSASRVVGGRASASSLRNCDTPTDQGHRGTASGSLSGWVPALPGGPSMRFCNDDFVLARRHFLEP